MAIDKKTLKDLARNTRYLRERKGWSQAELGKRSGLGQKTISNVENAVYNAKQETAEDIGRAFGLTGWNMISPWLVRDTESGGTITKLIESYIEASDEGQQLILQIAEREAKYRSKK